MRIKSKLTTLIAVLAVAALIFQSCKKQTKDDPPTADFYSTLTTGEAPLTVEYIDQSSNNPTNWQWDFGDGGSSIQKNPTHTYNTDGSFTVTLNVTNSHGSDIKSKADYIIVSGSDNTPPTALFTVSPTIGTTSTNFTFDASSSTDNETPTSQLQVRWDFDGNDSWDTDWGTDKTQNHQYSIEATHTAKLEVKDTEGLTDQCIKSITVTNDGGGTGTFTDARDGQTYATVDIGSQTWFSENLNYQTDDSWWYDNSIANGDVYGRLYTWNAALTACPSGWHLPSDDEWKTLEMALGMSQSEADNTGYRGTNEGEKMKAISGWYNDGNGTNSSGFGGLPGGYYNSTSFYALRRAAHLWSSTGTGGGALVRSLFSDGDKVNRDYFNQELSFSVRCVKD